MAKIATASKRSTTNTANAKTETRESARRVSGAGSVDADIEKLAYQFYVERGYQHGFDREDWLRAEAIVKARRS